MREKAIRIRLGLLFEFPVIPENGVGPIMARRLLYDFSRLKLEEANFESISEVRGDIIPEGEGERESEMMFFGEITLRLKIAEFSWKYSPA